MANKIKNLHSKTNSVNGWLTPNEGKTLYNLAKNCKGNGVIVEIGSWQGKSTIYLGHGSKDGNGVKIYAIGPHTGSPEHRKELGKVWTFKNFQSNIKNAEIGHLVEPIVEFSYKASKNFKQKIELIFIDGAHEYEAVKLDFDLWFSKVINGGVIAFHDTVGWDGPRKVVEDSVFKSNQFRQVKFADYSITYATKVEQNSFFDRARNRYVLFLKNIYEGAMNIGIPKPLIYLLKMIIRLIH